MRVPLEDLVPYDQSLQWRIHDAYFAKRGIAAWTQGSIPFRPTSNFAFARQNALLIAKVARELENAGKLGPQDPIHVLEVGAGLGQFAAYVFRALESSCGPLGKRTAARLRYVLSDYSEINVRESSASLLLKDLVAQGRIVPALFDLRSPTVLKGLDGQPIDARFVAAVTNYICCVAPLKMVRKQDGRFEERWTRVEAEFPDTEVAPTAAALLEGYLANPTALKIFPDLKVESEWRACDLDALFPDRFHADTIRAALSPFEEATISYPYSYVDFVRALRTRMVDGGVLLVNDYGNTDAAAWQGLRQTIAQHYGNTLNHGVNFALFDTLGARLSLTVLRTDNALRALHTAAIRFAPEVPQSFRRVFHNTQVRHEDGEDFMALLDAGRAAQDKNEHARAARLLERALALDPENVEILMRIATAYIDAKCQRRALEFLERGRALDREKKHDFEFSFGRAYYGLGRLEEAIAYYDLSNARAEDPATFTNIGAICEEKKDFRGAYRNFKEALRVQADYERAKTLLQELMQRWCEVSLGGADKAERPAS